MAKSIMIQGTMSNVGKSIIAAGLCRIFHQDGYRTAPFKAQNMALNSFITKEGLEMGRAQAVQAEAAGIDPEVDMNPILLKPSSDVGSQVILNGRVLGNLDARSYFSYKKKLLPDVKAAFHRLSEKNDIVVIEGAGSPAEINLRDADCFVNMDMAKIADAPVLLVGDIDRGGVFAQLVGTMELLLPDERARVAGLIINKFRGDPTLMGDGNRMLEEKTGVSVLGIMPYLDLHLEDEDSLSDRLNRVIKVHAPLEIAVIRYPRISNFTDLDVFDMIDTVSVRYIQKIRDLENPDLIILPGSKDTIGDLLWMRESGLESRILKLHASGTPVFGICGGYQMLGETLTDPYGVERKGTFRGIGLLPMDTVFEKQKTRREVKGRLAEIGGALSGLSGCPVEGYEIHMGRSSLSGQQDADTAGTLARIRRISGLSHADNSKAAEFTGFISEEPADEDKTSVPDTGDAEFPDGLQYRNVYGTYIHGIFDAGDTAARLVQLLAERKGLTAAQMEVMDYRTFKEQQYNILADSMRKNLDIDRIYRILFSGSGN